MSAQAVDGLGVSVEEERLMVARDVVDHVELTVPITDPYAEELVGRPAPLAHQSRYLQRLYQRLAVT